MAAGGYKEFVAGETLDQDEINDYLMQGVLVFAGTAARGSAIGTPVEGQFSYLADTDALEFYDGSAWVGLSSTPGTAAAEISGGNGTATSGGFEYHTFTSNGNLTVDVSGVMEVFLVGGGGGGGSSSSGGGGGAGGFVFHEISLPAGIYAVTVGAGGAVDANGADSSILNTDLVVPGPTGNGGGAGGAYADNGNDGGSGGGGGGGASTSGGSSNQPGASGGTGRADAFSDGRAGGGGGGANEAGENGGYRNAGDGGDGTFSFNVWASATSTGSSSRYAGGGGGLCPGVSAGPGGSGGGGTGGSNGTVNTGGGGGGTASGGSGIVIVRVAV